MISSMSEMLKYMVMVAANSTSQKLYTTGQLSKIFGVSITSINNWISEERFIGIQRFTRNKQVRISENTMWRSPNGEIMAVKEVAEMWNKENQKTICLSRDEEITILRKEINFFEVKYGGIYENTLKLKEQITESELQDKEEWVYLLKRILE